MFTVSQVYRSCSSRRDRVSGKRVQMGKKRVSLVLKYLSLGPFYRWKS